LGVGSLSLFGPFAWILKKFQTEAESPISKTTEGNTKMIRESFELGYQWPTLDPFLFCVHHLDHFPKGSDRLGVTRDHLKGRTMGQDFEPRDGFRMYHGQEVPGFPVHPHRGFETVTVVRRGYVDHADSMGAAGRYGEGDVQWMTAGDGVQHSEMFPLLHKEQPNPVELFQIWLNLPGKKKRVAPFFRMFWSEEIPVIKSPGCEVTVIAGDFSGTLGLSPPPNSWAADSDNGIGIWLIALESGSTLRVPAAAPGIERVLYFYEGEELDISGERVGSGTGHHLSGNGAVDLKAHRKSARILVLQAKPIGEPVVQQGPFVMNSREEILQTIQRYRTTEFGGWPWDRDDMVHGKEIRRFAKYPDGRIETPRKV
jgi:redox-sensitive bicupin YhaK (pirin superfamily)